MLVRTWVGRGIEVVTGAEQDDVRLGFGEAAEPNRILHPDDRLSPRAHVHNAVGPIDGSGMRRAIRLAQYSMPNAQCPMPKPCKIALEHSALSIVHFTLMAYGWRRG